MEINETNYSQLNHGQRFLNYIQQLMHRSACTDVTLQCEGTYVASCHRLILAALSSHFETALSSVSHCAQVTLDVDTAITGVNCIDMKRIVDFMYYGRVDLPEGATSLFTSAQTLGVGALVHLLKGRGTEHVAIQARDHGSLLLAAVNRLNLSGKFADVDINCEGSFVTSCHRFVLQAFSGYFNGALSTSGNAAQTIVVDIDSISTGVTSCDLMAMVEFLYKGTMRMKKQQIRSIYNAATVLSVNPLIEFMSNHVAELNNKAVGVKLSSCNATTGRKLKLLIPKEEVTSLTNNKNNGTRHYSDPMDGFLADYDDDDLTEENGAINGKFLPESPIDGLIGGTDPLMLDTLMIPRSTEICSAEELVFEPPGTTVATELVISSSGTETVCEYICGNGFSSEQLVNGNSRNSVPNMESAECKRHNNFVVQQHTNNNINIGNGSLNAAAALNLFGSAKRKFKGAAPHRALMCSDNEDTTAAAMYTTSSRKRNESVLSLMSNASDDDLVLTSNTGTVKIKFNRRKPGQSDTVNRQRYCVFANGSSFAYPDSDGGAYPMLIDAADDNNIHESESQLLSSNYAAAFPDAFRNSDQDFDNSDQDVKPIIAPDGSVATAHRNYNPKHNYAKSTTCLLRSNNNSSSNAARQIKVKAKKVEHQRTQSTTLEERMHQAALQGLKLPVVARRNRVAPVENSKFKCDICKRCFKSAYSLKMHKETHSKELMYECSLCSHVAKTLATLKAHVKLKHCVDLEGKKLKKNFKCTQCGERYLYSSQLDLHIRRKHLAERAFKCPYCDHRSTENSALQKHIRCLHTGDTPYKCKICKKAFKIQSNLVRHLRSHTGEKPYLCSECDVSYADKKNLDQHMLKRHDIPRQHRYMNPTNR